MNRPTFLAFDIDGTLFDCGDIIADAFRDGIRRFGGESAFKIEVPSKEKIISVIGQPVHFIFTTLFPSLDEAGLIRINDLCTGSLIDIIDRGGGSLIDGVYDNLERLSGEGYSMYVASNGRLDYIEAILNSTRISRFISLPVVTIDGIIKTKTDIVRYYRNNISINDVLIMIGDRASDRIAAAENNIPFIGCNFGHGGFEELEGARWVAQKFGDVYNIIKKIEAEAADST